MDSTHSIFEQALNDARQLIKTSQSDNYLIDFPYSTFTIPRPGEEKNEPGRQNFRNTLNLNNLKIVEQFVKKHQLDVTADPEKVFLPRLKQCLISDFGQEKFDTAENNHRQKWRLVEGIGAFINQTLTWAKELTEFVNNPHGTHRDHILELIQNIDKVVISADDEKTNIQANIKKPQ